MENLGNLAVNGQEDVMMLHLELHAPDTTEAMEWVGVRPKSLRDPTPFLLEASAWR